MKYINSGQEFQKLLEFEFTVAESVAFTLENFEGNTW